MPSLKVLPQLSVENASTDLQQRVLVLLLASKECSLGEIVAILRLDLKYLHYHVGALQQFGLLVVAHERARAGRRVKVYRAVAKAFFVPTRLLPAEPSNALNLELCASLAKTRDRSLEGVLYDLGDNDEPRTRPIGNPAIKSVAASDLWRVLSLSHAEAQRLSKDLGQCLKHCMHRDLGVTRDYLVHIALAPRFKSVKARARVSRRFERSAAARTSK